MSWVYEQATGKLYNPDGNFVAKGYAGGNCGKNPEGKNNPALQGVKSVGPLPVGIYTLGDPVLQSHLGPFAIPLVPDSSNIMYNRGDFFIHGDAIDAPGSASEGCVIMPRNIRNNLWCSLDHQIQVIAYVTS